MNSAKVINHIVDWLKTYSSNSNTKGFVIGVSGGIDSALVSTLAALSNEPVFVISMPIYQNNTQLKRANEHIDWLCKKHSNVKTISVDLTDSFKALENTFDSSIQDELTMANTRARLRMSTLFAYAGHYKCLVVGTGNKVEDFGVGFFTKYGDGGVDLSPIADLNKSEVFALAKELGISDSIQKAKPTDGLWEDDRSDEDQIGATYPELEWAMDYIDSKSEKAFSKREDQVMEIYLKLNRANQHKMLPIPVCKISEEIKV